MSSSNFVTEVIKQMDEVGSPGYVPDEIVHDSLDNITTKVYNIDGVKVQINPSDPESGTRIEIGEESYLVPLEITFGLTLRMDVIFENYSMHNDADVALFAVSRLESDIAEYKIVEG